MRVMTSDSFQIVGERSQILVYTVEEEAVRPKVRELLCGVPSSFTVSGPVFTGHGGAREGEGPLLRPGDRRRLFLTRD